MWEAGIEVINKTQTPTDVQIIRFAAEAQRERAEKRRGPSAGATQPFTIGMVVREANMKYVKASSSLRGNKLKMGWPRAWQITTSKVTAVRGGGDRPFEYQLDDRDRWVSHDRLKRVYGEEDPPAATLQDRDYYPFRQVGNTTYYRGFPWPEA